MKPMRTQPNPTAAGLDRRSCCWTLRPAKVFPNAASGEEAVDSFGTKFSNPPCYEEDPRRLEEHAVLSLLRARQKCLLRQFFASLHSARNRFDTWLAKEPRLGISRSAVNAQGRRIAKYADRRSLCQRLTSVGQTVMSLLQKPLS